MSRTSELYAAFLSKMGPEPTSCQDAFLRRAASFLLGDEGDILVLDGYAGTGKTTALSAVISALEQYHVPTVLLAPTGRSAKVLSSYAGRPAYTVHRHIYRQKSVDESGLGVFTRVPNKAVRTLFIVDEVSLIGMESDTPFGSGNLLADLVDFVRSGADCRLILAGDSAQLPPVGLETSPALDKEYMSAFGGVSFCSMTTVVRQQEDSGILRLATHLRNMLPPSPGAGLSDLHLPLAGAEVERLGGAALIDVLAGAYDRYGEDNTIVLTRSNRRANRYNAGIRAQVLFKEERLTRGDRLMVVKNCYKLPEDIKDPDFIANGDMVNLLRISRYEERYGLHFAEARLSLPDYGDIEFVSKVCLDTLDSESPSLAREQQNSLYQGVDADYSHIRAKGRRYEAVKSDPYYNALQLKYADAVTCHKSQGGQWDCVFIDNPLWQDMVTEADIKWLYTAVTRGVRKLYLINFPDLCFEV